MKIYAVEAVPDQETPQRLDTTSCCPLCESRDAERLYFIPDVEKRIVRCPTCGIARMEPLPSEAELRSFYPTEYYGSRGQKFETLIERLLSRER